MPLVSYLKDARRQGNTFLRKYVLVMGRNLNNLTFVKAGSREDSRERATKKNRLHIGSRIYC